MYGEKGHAAVKSELSQIHDRGVFEPQDPNKLTHDQIKNCLESHLFLEEKKDKEVKGRIVGDGSKQRSYVSKQEAYSPTYHTESVFCTFGIEAEEGRDIAIIDIPNAFVQTDLVKNDKPVKIVMVIRGKLAQMLCDIAPDTYKKYMTRDRNGNPVLYVKLLKALYGLMEASLMFYQKLLKDLNAKGFVVNPYDPCVANKVINGEQFTIVWHVDDLKLSHKDPKVVTEMINYLKNLYEKLPNGEVKLTDSQRLSSSNKVLNYLGMDFDFSVKKQVSISMVHYVDKIIKSSQMH